MPKDLHVMIIIFFLTGIKKAKNMSSCFTKELTPSVSNLSHDEPFDSLSSIESSDDESLTDESEAGHLPSLMRKMTRFELECVIHFSNSALFNFCRYK